MTPRRTRWARGGALIGVIMALLMGESLMLFFALADPALRGSGPLVWLLLFGGGGLGAAAFGAVMGMILGIYASMIWRE